MREGLLEAAGACPVCCHQDLFSVVCSAKAAENESLEVGALPARRAHGPRRADAPDQPRVPALLGWRQGGARRGRLGRLPAAGRGAPRRPFPPRRAHRRGAHDPPQRGARPAFALMFCYVGSTIFVPAMVKAELPCSCGQTFCRLLQRAQCERLGMNHRYLVCPLGRPC